jgi:hypothetical protein
MPNRSSEWRPVLLCLNGARLLAALDLPNLT